jgi:hypothetical protein
LGTPTHAPVQEPATNLSLQWLLFDYVSTGTPMPYDAE